MRFCAELIYEDRNAARKKILRSDSSVQAAVANTLAYAAVFNYPLQADEIWKYLIVPNVQFAISNCQFVEALEQLQRRSIVYQQDGYYFLPGMESSVVQRQKREKIALKKFARANNFSKWARFIPTIKLIGVSGALAMKNAHEEDDIDLFIVAQTGTVWLTRLLTVLLAELLGGRRRPEIYSINCARASLEETVKDKLCLNMFVDEAHLGVPENERDLFSAHEVVQMQPIYEKEGTYIKFLRANSWVEEFLPTAMQIQRAQRTAHSASLKFKMKLPHIAYIAYPKLPRLDFVEKIVKIAQQYYMKNKITNEVIGNGYLRFHPVDARRIILRRYQQILTEIAGKLNE